MRGVGTDVAVWGRGCPDGSDGPFTGRGHPWRIHGLCGVSGRLWSAGGRTWPVPARGLQGHGMAKCSARWPSTCTGPCTGERTRSISGPQRLRGPRSRSSCTPFDLGFCGAPGRIRTCGHRIRSPVLYPLSYGCLIQLSPAVAGRDHVVTRGPRGFPDDGSAGGWGAAYGREGPRVVAPAAHWSDILGYSSDLAHRWAKPHQLR